MSQPITWRNVTGPSPAEASRPLELAQQSINGVFDNFGNMIAKRQAMDAGNVANADENNKQAYLGLLSGAKTIDQLGELQRSGALDRAMQTMSSASQAAVRGADEARGASLRTNLTAGQVFENQQRDVRDAPILEQAAALRAAGKTTESDALLAANPQLRVASTAIAANRVEALRRTQDARTVVQQGQADALALVKSPNDIATETFKAALRPTEQANAIKEGALKSTTLDLNTTDANNQVQDRLIESATAGVAQKYQDDQLKGRVQLGELAKKRGFPVDSSGAPDIANMDKGQRLQLDADAGLAGLRSTRELFAGDTSRSEEHLSDLRKDTRITPESISRNQARITGAFNTVANGAPVGNDALARATKQAQADVIQKEKDGRNRFAPGSPDALTAYTDLSKQVEAALPDNVKEDGPHLQNMLMRFATKGIEIRPGVFVTPSVTDIMGEVNGYTTNFGGNLLNKTRARDIEDNLKKTLSGVDVTKLLADAEESRMANRQRDVRSILNPLTPAMAPLNPLNLPTPQKK